MGNNVNNSYLFIAIYIFTAYLLIKAIYGAFFTKLKTFEDYQKRSAHFVSYFKARQKAINVMESAIIDLNLKNDEKISAIFQIGVQYHYKRDYTKAITYFDQVWGYIKKSKIPYEKMLACIIVSNYNVGNKEKAREVYHILKNKGKYDPRYEQLSYLESTIFK
ncbi:MAG: hypothetical protein WBH44_08270 [Proteocatella sp.]